MNDENKEDIKTYIVRITGGKIVNITGKLSQVKQLPVEIIQEKSIN